MTVYIIAMVAEVSDFLRQMSWIRHLDSNTYQMLIQDAGSKEYVLNNALCSFQDGQTTIPLSDVAQRNTLDVLVLSQFRSARIDAPALLFVIAGEAYFVTHPEIESMTMPKVLPSQEYAEIVEGNPSSFIFWPGRIIMRWWLNISTTATTASSTSSLPAATTEGSGGVRKWASIAAQRLTSAVRTLDRLLQPVVLVHDALDAASRSSNTESEHSSDNHVSERISSNSSNNNSSSCCCSSDKKSVTWNRAEADGLSSIGRSMTAWTSLLSCGGIILSRDIDRQQLLYSLSQLSMPNPTLPATTMSSSSGTTTFVSVPWEKQVCLDRFAEHYRHSFVTPTQEEIMHKEFAVNKRECEMRIQTNLELLESISAADPVVRSKAPPATVITSAPSPSTSFMATSAATKVNDNDALGMNTDTPIAIGTTLLGASPQYPGVASASKGESGISSAVMSPLITLAKIGPTSSSFISCPSSSSSCASVEASIIQCKEALRTELKCMQTMVENYTMFQLLPRARAAEHTTADLNINTGKNNTPHKKRDFHEMQEQQQQGDRQQRGQSS